MWGHFRKFAHLSRAEFSLPSKFFSAFFRPSYIYIGGRSCDFFSAGYCFSGKVVPIFEGTGTINPSGEIKTHNEAVC